MHRTRANKGVKLLDMTFYRTLHGRLVTHRDRGKSPQLFPTALGGHVSIDLTRAEAAYGLRMWRSLEAT